MNILLDSSDKIEDNKYALKEMKINYRKRLILKHEREE
jgi:hypothetical protein